MADPSHVAPDGATRLPRPGARLTFRMEDAARHKTWYNEDKVDETVLALLWLTASRHPREELPIAIAGTDTAVFRRLEARGLVILSAQTHTATLTGEGRRDSERLFIKLFGSPMPATLPSQPAGQRVEEEDGE